MKSFGRFLIIDDYQDDWLMVKEGEEDSTNYEFLAISYIFCSSCNYHVEKKNHVII